MRLDFVLRNGPRPGENCMAYRKPVDLNLLARGASYVIPSRPYMNNVAAAKGPTPTKLGFGDEPCLCDLQIIYILNLLGWRTLGVLQHGLCCSAGFCSVWRPFLVVRTLRGDKLI